MALLVALVAAFWLLPSPWHHEFEHLPEQLRPHRPLWIVAADTAAGLFLSATKLCGGYPQLYARDLMRAAEVLTGLGDWQDPEGTFLAGLEQLGQALETEAELTALGRLLTWVQMTTILQNRLKIIQYSKVLFAQSTAAVGRSSFLFALGTPDRRGRGDRLAYFYHRDAPLGHELSAQPCAARSPVSCAAPLGDPGSSTPDRSRRSGDRPLVEVLACLVDEPPTPSVPAPRAASRSRAQRGCT